MAFITKEEVSTKRAAIKAAFPAKSGWRFSVTGGGSSTLNVKIMIYPAGYEFPEQGQVNHHWIDESMKRHGLGEKEQAACRKIIDIMKDGHWDKSDIQTDYFHCSYYYYLDIGKWNKPSVCHH